MSSPSSFRGRRPCVATHRWISSKPAMELLNFATYFDLDWPVQDTSQITLESQQADLRLHASHWHGTIIHSAYCTCAMLPEHLSTSGGEVLSSLYPALPASVTDVQLRVPGFPALTGPVTRK